MLCRDCGNDGAATAAETSIGVGLCDRCFETRANFLSDAINRATQRGRDATAIYVVGMTALGARHIAAADITLGGMATPTEAAISEVADTASDILEDVEASPAL